jgi:hypothetical protein
VLALTGTGLADVDTVAVGAGPCDVTGYDSNTSTLFCDTGPLVVGVYPVLVRDHEKGYPSDGAGGTPTLSYTAKLRITSVSPMEGSLAGGTKVTISGNGFSDTANAVTVGTVAMRVITQSPTQIVAYTPRGGSSNGAAEDLGPLDVVVTATPGSGYEAEHLVTVATEAAAFTYTVAATPTLSSVSPTEVSAGAEITIGGSGLLAVSLPSFALCSPAK